MKKEAIKVINYYIFRNVSVFQNILINLFSYLEIENRT